MFSSYRPVGTNGVGTYNVVAIIPPTIGGANAGIQPIPGIKK
jgi:hypothetical protein